MERNIDRNGSPKPRVLRDVRTFGDLIDLHDEDMREGGKPPRRSEAAVMASLKAELGSVKLPALNRERLIDLGRKRAKQGAGPGTLAIDFSFILCDQTFSVSQLTPFCVFAYQCAFGFVGLSSRVRCNL